MARVYADLIRKGFMVLKRVPDELKEETEKYLQDDAITDFEESVSGLAG